MLEEILREQKKRAGRLIVISGPSGVGKDTVIRGLIEVCPGIERCTTYTTRDPRSGEVPGVDYKFICEDEFRRMIEAGEFLEHAQVHLDLYGTPLEGCDAVRERGMDAVLKIDVQGGLQVRSKAPDALMIFVAPPSYEELERRLRARYTDSEEAIRKRLENARKEIEQIPHYDYLVVNDEIESAVDRLRCIILAERAKIGFLR